jgi:hypothetical protein
MLYSEIEKNQIHRLFIYLCIYLKNKDFIKIKNKNSFIHA